MHFFKEHTRLLEIFICGLDVSISDLSLNLLAPSFLIIVLSLFLRNLDVTPTNLQMFFEVIYDSIYDFLYSQLGERCKVCIPYMVYLTLYIVLLNFLNLIPWIYGATSQFFVNFVLACFVFCMVFFVGFKTYGWKIFKHFILKVPSPLREFLFNLELISFFLRPVTLAARLSINMLVGHMLLSMLSAIRAYRVAIVFSVLLSIMEIFVALLQAYIFIVLACVYIAEMSHEH